MNSLMQKPPKHMGDVEITDDPSYALRDLHDGSTVLVGGFGGAGLPNELTEALVDHSAQDLTVVSNNAGTGTNGLAALLATGRVRKMICSFPRQKGSDIFDDLYRAGEIELELVPQGTLAERIRAAGAGIGGFYTRTGAGTMLADDKETKIFGGREHVLEHALYADLALIKAHTADHAGNLIYRKTGRNFGPIMATAATTTIAQVDHVMPRGSLDPESIVTPGIFVDRVVTAARKETQ